MSPQTYGCILIGLSCVGAWAAMCWSAHARANKDFDDRLGDAARKAQWTPQELAAIQAAQHANRCIDEAKRLNAQKTLLAMSPQDRAEGGYASVETYQQWRDRRDLANYRYPIERARADHQAAINRAHANDSDRTGGPESWGPLGIE